MKSKLAIATLAILLAVPPIHGGFGFRSLLREDFESISPPSLPSGWVITNDNGDLGVWQTRAYGGVTWGKQCVRYISDPGGVTGGDDWCFSPGIDLDAGETYEVRFMYRCSTPGTPEAMSVWFGTAQAGGSMTEMVFIDPAIANTDYVEGAGMFTPVASGTYYVGFHAESPPGSGRLFLDDINVLTDNVEGLELTLMMPGMMEQDPPVYAPDDSIVALVYVENNGGTTPLMNRRLSVGQWPSDVEIEFVVTDPFGQDVPCINMYSRKLDIGPEWFSTVEPDSLFAKFVNLWNWYRFETLGTYMIYAHYRNYADPGGMGAWQGELISDPVVITVE
jgi:hypothetical protein